MAYRSQLRQTLHYLARPRTPAPRAPIGGAAAWRAGELAARRDWEIALTPDEARELVDAVARAKGRGRPLRELVAADFPLPTLGARIPVWRNELAHGRGVVVLRGVPVERLTREDSEHLFWGLGLHLGIPGAQNPKGDLLGHVVDEGRDSQTDVRAYRTRTRIAFHCDAADVVGLLCLHQAPVGGRSLLASSVAVHDEVLRRRPDLAPLLYAPFLLDTKDEGGVRYFPVLPCSLSAGQLRTFYHADYYRSVERHADAPRLTEAQRELLDLYDAIAESPEFCVEMDLAPGDVQLLSNHTVIHGRTAYEDAAGGAWKRHLLRLWLSLPGRDERPGLVGAKAALLGELGRARAGEVLRGLRG